MNTKTIDYIPMNVVGHIRIREQCAILGCRNRIVGTDYFKIDMKDYKGGVKWQIVLCPRCAEKWEW